MLGGIVMRKNFYKVKFGNYYFIFKLESIIKKQQVSKYKIEKDTGIDHKTLQNYCYGTLKRLDLRVVSTLCEYLDCDMTDIVELEKENI